MESKHVALLVGAALLAVIGIYAAKHVAGTVKPAVDIDDQMNLLRGQ